MRRLSILCFVVTNMQNECSRNDFLNSSFPLTATSKSALPDPVPPLGSSVQVPPLAQGSLVQLDTRGGGLQPGTASTSSSSTECALRGCDLSGSSRPFNTTSCRQPLRPLATPACHTCPPKKTLVSRLSVRRLPCALPEAVCVRSSTRRA